MPYLPPRAKMPHAAEDVEIAIRLRNSEQSRDTPQAPSETDPPTERFRIKNRRKRYLDIHPEYFQSADIELAGKYNLFPKCDFN